MSEFNISFRATQFQCLKEIFGLLVDYSLRMLLVKTRFIESVFCVI